MINKLYLSIINLVFELFLSFTGFWGGLIPENALNTTILEGLLSAGVLGVKVTI